MSAGSWFDDLPTLYGFERDARREHGRLQRRVVGLPPCLVYEFELDVPAYDEVRHVRVEFIAAAVPMPSVFADGPSDSPHRYADGSLCMFDPADPPDRRWVPSDGLASLIDCIRAHLFQEAELRGGRGWPGDEAPHGRQTATRRR